MVWETQVGRRNARKPGERCDVLMARGGPVFIAMAGKTGERCVVVMARGGPVFIAMAGPFRAASPPAAGNNPRGLCPCPPLSPGRLGI